MGVPLETVTVQHERAYAPRQVRISRNVKRAIEVMVHQAQKRPDAARTAGITDDALRKAMLKPEVLAYLNAQQQVLRTSAAARSLARIDALADDAKSEQVKLGASTYLYEVEHGKPTQRTENTHVHAHFVPGLTIAFMGEAPARQITEQMRDSELPQHIKALPQPIPHPSLRNATIDGDFRVEPEGQPSATRGQK